MSNLLKVVFSFQEVNRSFVDKVGTKGANLGELHQLGVPVPPGFIISSDAYFYFLDMSNLREKITTLLSHIDIENNIELNKASSQIEEMIMKSKLPPVIEHEVVKAYSKLSGFSDALVAVRSSATAEDLPDASFAGQQSTYLNIKGKKEVLLALKAAWASLFEPRAIYYRQIKGFDHMAIGVAVPIQKMIQSEVSGTIFTIDPIKNDVSKVTIEAVLGLGEAIVGGELTPDHYTLDKESFSIVQKNIASQPWMLIRKPSSKTINDLNQKVTVPKKWQNAQKLDDRSLVTLANIGKVVEAHYGYPQDMEWAVEKGKLWIVQTRPVTTIQLTDLDKQFEEKIAHEVQKAQEEQHMAVPLVEEEVVSQVINLAPPISHEPATAPDIQAEHPLAHTTEEESEPSQEADIPTRIVVNGAPASVGVAKGIVHIITDPAQMGSLQQGEILVTTMTNPTWTPIMKKAAAIITDQGGMTSHAAIISRELGIPAVVGTQIATKILKNGEQILVDGGKGTVAEFVKDEEEQKEEQPIEEAPSVSVSITSPEEVKIEEPAMPVSSELELFKDTSISVATPQAVYKKIKTATKVYVNLADADIADALSERDVDGVGLLRSGLLLMNYGTHPKKLIAEQHQGELVEYMSENIGAICKAFKDSPVLLQSANLQAYEYKALKGGEEFEGQEENPLIGYRGAMRSITNPDMFKIELDAIKIVRNKMGYKNLHLVVPFVHSLHELRDIKKLVAASELKRSSTFKLHMMVEVPANVILIEEFLKIGIDGIVFGSNTLTQLILGLDRANAQVQSGFDAKNEAMLWAYKRVIKACLKQRISSCIDEYALSVCPELLKDLVKDGISGVCVDPDSIEKTRERIAQIEREHILHRRKV